MRDYYRLLGVERGATADDLKKAFRKLALKYHPDRNPEDKESEERFKEINEAYSTLSDPEKRMNYDRFGTTETPGFEPFRGGFGDIFDNIFGDFFGTLGGRGAQRPAKGNDLRYDLGITLDEAAFGTEKVVEVPRWEACSACRGTGSKGKGPVICSRCKGAGQVRFQQGFFNISKTCDKCHGQGKIIADPCEACSGEGRARRYRKLSVRVPAGVDAGSRLRMTGEGELGERGGPPGDLYIVVDVKEHPVFKREGTNLYFEMPLTFPQAALGAEVEVPTLNGINKLRIPPGTQAGENFHVKGHGMPRLGSRLRGDLIAVAMVTVPKHLSQRQREILDEFARISGDDASEAKSLKDKLKDLFTGAGTA